jgi:hypothetical protein
VALAAEEATAATKRLKSARYAAPSPAVSADVTRTPQATSQSVKVAKTGMVLARARVFDAAKQRPWCMEPFRRLKFRSRAKGMY